MEITYTQKGDYLYPNPPSTPQMMWNSGSMARCGGAIFGSTVKPCTGECMSKAP